MAKLFELRKLSKEFYKAHPHSEYLELQQMTFFIINMFKNTLMIISIIKSMVETNMLLKDMRSLL